MIREELPWFVKCDPQFQRICSLSELRVSNKVRDGVGIEGEGNGWRMVQRQKWVLKLAASAIYQSMVNNFHSTVDFPDGISKGNCRCSWLANSKKTKNERKKCRNPWWTNRENSKWDAWYRESGFLSYSATAYRRFSTISRRFNCFNRRKGLSSTISRSLNTFLYLWWTRGKNPDGRKKERKKYIPTMLDEIEIKLIPEDWCSPPRWNYPLSRASFISYPRKRSKFRRTRRWKSALLHLDSVHFTSRAEHIPFIGSSLEESRARAKVHRHGATAVRLLSDWILTSARCRSSTMVSSWTNKSGEAR